MEQPNAQLVHIEPGDGTRYIVCVGRLPNSRSANEVFVAIGTADIIRGAVVCNIEDTITELQDGNYFTERGTITDLYSVSEYFIDTKGTNRWTAAVAVLCAFLYLKYGLFWMDHVHVIGQIYEGKQIKF